MRRSHVAIISYILPFTSALSLANFQQISPGAVSIVCLVTYDSPIPGCKVTDFQDGAACSTSCVAGLEAIGQAVNEACSGIQVSSATLLGMIFENKMVGALCPNTISTTTAVPATTQSATVIPTVKSTPSTTAETSVSTSSIISSTTSISTTSTTPIIVKTTSATSVTTESSSSQTIKKTTSAAEATSATSTSSSTSALTSSSSIATSLAFDSTSTPRIISTPTFTSNKVAPTHQAHKSEQQIQIEASKDTGGGSPFDIVDEVDSGGSIQMLGADLRLIFMCLAVIIGALVGL